LLILREKL
jgi:hypothetical protein